MRHPQPDSRFQSSASLLNSPFGVCVHVSIFQFSSIHWYWCVAYETPKVATNRFTCLLHQTPVAALRFGSMCQANDRYEPIYWHAGACKFLVDSFIKNKAVHGNKSITLFLGFFAYKGYWPVFSIVLLLVIKYSNEFLNVLLLFSKHSSFYCVSLWNLWGPLEVGTHV